MFLYCIVGGAVE